MLILLILLTISIALKIFPPERPNPWFGYQGWNAKGSEVKWKVANSFFANYTILLSSSAIVLFYLFQYLKLDDLVYSLIYVVVGLLVIIYLVEKKIKNVV